MSILVVGSVNADIVLHLERLPRVGETVAASNDSGYMVAGGKGANQAVAAARLSANSESSLVHGGAAVAFAGRFGRDAHGAALRAVLRENRVDLAFSDDAAPGTPTGQAFILLQAGGDNSIVIVGGANVTWAAELPPTLVRGIGDAALVLLQREVPDHVNVAVARTARAHGVHVLMDVGGRADPLPAELLPLVTILSPNESELARCLGRDSIGESDDEVANQRAVSPRAIASGS